MTGLLDLVRSAKRPERTVSLCLRADLVAEYEGLERQLTAATQRDVESFGGSGESVDLAARMDEVRAEMLAASVVFRLRSLGPVRSTTIVADHPPRDGNEHDRTLGYNSDTYYRALIRECCYALETPGETVVLRDDNGEPTDAMSEDDWASLIGAPAADPPVEGSLSYQQFDELFGATWLLDHGDISVPTSALASLISQRNDESLNRPDAGVSPRDDSQDGNPDGSPTSSTTTPDDSSA